jgi:protein SCO1/2
MHNYFLTGRSCLGYLLIALLALTGCQPKSPQASSDAQRYEIKGKVVSADKKNYQVTIAHEAIPGYMEAMTMPFTLREEWVYSELAPGTLIQATLVVDQGISWLENPVVTKIADPNLVGKSEETGVEPAAGAEVPNFSLVNQDNQKIGLKKYRNRALILTFIYTRCPLPDYCPLISRNFQQVLQEIQKRPELKDKARMLSISVDPAYDKPKVLREYGARYVGSSQSDAFRQWEFASGSPEEIKEIAQFFGLNYWTEGDQIIHGLRTAVIAPDGKVVKVFRGNDWKPEEVLSELERLK